MCVYVCVCVWDRERERESTIILIRIITSVCDISNSNTWKVREGTCGCVWERERERRLWSRALKCIKCRLNFVGDKLSLDICWQTKEKSMTLVKVDRCFLQCDNIILFWTYGYWFWLLIIFIVLVTLDLILMNYLWLIIFVFFTSLAWESFLRRLKREIV